MPQINSVCDVAVLSPETDFHTGCPVLAKARHIVLKKGTQATVRWELRQPNGESVDLTSCFPDQEEESLSASLESPSHNVLVRFADCDTSSRCVYQVEAVVVENNPATIEFAVPPEVATDAGIYHMSLGLTPADDDNSPLFVETGLLSVEGDSLWGNPENAQSPPTLNDIRMALNDFPETNALLGRSEFSAIDIMQALVWPIRQWNETPPPLAPMTCRTFPFRYHWRQAVVGELLRQAVHHYARNNMAVSHGGVTGNFKDKHREYLQLAELYSNEWRTFIDAKKIEINARQGFMTLGSSYGW